VIELLTINVEWDGSTARARLRYGRGWQWLSDSPTPMPHTSHMPCVELGDELANALGDLIRDAAADIELSARLTRKPETGEDLASRVRSTLF
jgi:hypothetical protein